MMCETCCLWDQNAQKVEKNAYFSQTVWNVQIFTHFLLFLLILLINTSWMKVTLVFVVYFILVSSMFCVYLQLRQIKKKNKGIF